jgi:hypothetical protein
MYIMPQSEDEVGSGSAEPDAVKAARPVLNAGDEETPKRPCALSLRNYAAEAVLLTRNVAFSSHRCVISAFGEHFVKTEIFPRDMGRAFNRAFEERQLGDYEYTFVLSRGEAEEILENGKSFVDSISQYLQERKLLYPSLCCYISPHLTIPRGSAGNSFIL